MEVISNSLLLGIILSCGSYIFGTWLQKKTRMDICNPLLVATIVCMTVITFFDMNFEQFYQGASVVQLFLTPATCALALSIYRQRKILQQHFVPIVCGCLVSSIVSIAGSFVLGWFFKLDEMVIQSTIPNSVTSAIAIDITKQLGGIVPIAILCVIITGVGGAILSPYLVKVFKITDEIEMGVAIGATSHVVGTSKAVEFGEIQGAMSGVAIGVSGLITVLLSLFL